MPSWRIHRQTRSSDCLRLCAQFWSIVQDPKLVGRHCQKHRGVISKGSNGAHIYLSLFLQ
jgi:hypothetical protein